MTKFNPEINQLSDRIKHLKEEGYVLDFRFEDRKLMTNEGKIYEANDIERISEYRFEGESNPSDMSILYAISMRDGSKGTIADVFGPKGNAALSQMILQLQNA